MGQSGMARVYDYILWYCRDVQRAKFRPVYEQRDIVDDKEYCYIAEAGGCVRKLAESEKRAWRDQKAILKRNDLRSSGYTPSCTFALYFQDCAFSSGGKSWRTNQAGMKRLMRAERLFCLGKSVYFRQYHGDFGVEQLENSWHDTAAGFSEQKVYVVQTHEKIIQRCLLMTTDPGDLVLDPTCGSGTTALVAEEWGRRWITIDVSRVALAIARQRLLTAKFDYYKLRPTSAADAERNPDGPWLTDPDGQTQGSCTFDCKTVAHITLKSIAQNQALDPVFEKWEPILAEKLAALNKALAEGATDDLHTRLLSKLEDKRKREGKKAITDADRRRWLLPPANREGRPYTTADNAFAGWYDWEVPFDADPDWPKPLQDALKEYREAWRAKMDEVNACIAARADQEELVDQPSVHKNRIRVSGPFTMEGVIPAEESIEDDAETHIAGAPEGLETFEGDGPLATEAQNTEAYLDRMVRYLREDGVRFPDNKVMKFSSLEALADGSTLHARGTWGDGKDERRVAVMFGPQYGPLVAAMVEDGIRFAARRGYDDLIFAAFSFDGAAQAVIQEDPDPKVRIHMAQIRPDVNMGDLLKTTVSSQLFTVSGSPRTKVEKQDDGQFAVHMEGVDIYDPVTNSVRSTGAEKVAAWFLDSDYDGRCFCVCQAFFPDKSAWDRLARALGGTLDEAVFEKFSGTVSLPFPAGKHKRVAVKVIDPRGNEVLTVRRLDETYR
jgi:adenine-specific DNA-methyltransferase